MEPSGESSQDQEQRPSPGEKEREAVRRLLRCLPPRHALRPGLLSLLEETPLPADAAERFRAVLLGARSGWEERALAAWALGLLPDREGGDAGL
ncbi:MAG TPA: hypothetical protein VKT32_08190, partial [Chthonomonadaceae bacterium]|nr:hypothetical protein [Chthonomonadaceae bacterium]